MNVFLTIFVLIAAIYETTALCNTCSATTGLACVGNSKFKVCTDGIPSGSALPCPNGTVCTSSAHICVPTGSAPSSCARCETCSDDNIFACVENNSFSLCSANGLPDKSRVYTCPENLICNVDAANICVSQLNTGLGATCPEPDVTTTTTTTTTTALTPSPTTVSTTTTESTTVTTPTIPTTTTPSPLTQPNLYCASKGFPGRYEISSDSTCRSFISCVSTNIGWEGSFYECPQGTFFNPTKQMCGQDRPSRCSNILT